MNAPVHLKVVDLHVAYGRVEVVRGISFEIAKGEIVSLIGPNGAGKSTIMAAIAGGVAASRGRVELDGRDLKGLRPEQIARLGLSFIPEGRHVFAALTVEENLQVGAAINADGNATGRRQQIYEYFPRLKERMHSPAGKLSGGEQQMLVIGRALMTGPSIILVDEPSLGLAPKIIDRVYEILLDLRRRDGLTLMINEQSTQRILKHADRVCVIRGGRVRLEGQAAELRSDDVSAAYFGFAAPAAQEDVSHA